MNILCIGDVCGNIGCEHLRRVLPAIKRENQVDFIIVNGENSADGNGILPHSAALLFDAGVDVITGGNHTFRRREIFDTLEENPRLLRPSNMPKTAFGKGYGIYDYGRFSVGVINLLGTTYMESMDCPFREADRILDIMQTEGVKIIIVDFHAEATSEKRALGFYLDGKVSALFGTHTHVQTADEQILPRGTGYITDVGMTGPVQSVLGVKPEIVISKFMDRMPVRFALSDGECEL
ncbi:MAG: TIGR00282 family metallophosphoesterase, partial [Clostridia bacterium]|nr:TIGR00282 family metallophosphoesterase [Clostridia bacterium]